MKPIIGVIGRPEILNSGTSALCMWENVRLAIIKKGGIPFLIIPPQLINYNLYNPIDAPKLNEDEKKYLYECIDFCDGLIVPGGDKWYEFDEVIYKYALEKDLPILGICAGMQLICKMDLLADELIKDPTIKNDNTLIKHKEVNKKYAHSINIMDNTNLKNIIGKNNINVNSKHNYHVPEVKNLTISAFSEDDLIEAVEYSNKKFVMGVQWHPESMLDYDKDADKIISTFINHCYEYKNNKKKNKVLKKFKKKV